MDDLRLADSDPMGGAASRLGAIEDDLTSGILRTELYNWLNKIR